MNYTDCLEKREEVASFMRRLYTQKLTTCSGGNISVRLDENHIIITPSSLDKALIQADQIGIISLEGENITPHLKPSIETGMHLEIYKKRPDIMAIVHAHPVHATSFTAMECKIDITLTAESFLVLKKIAYPEYAIMGSAELATNVAESLIDSNVAIMKNHGVTTVGNSLLSAFDKIEVLENAAIMTLNNHITKSISPLNKEQLDEILTKF